MKKTFFKLAVLALMIVGMLVISSCKKEPQDLFEDALSEKMQCKSSCHNILMTVDKSSTTMTFTTETSEVTEDSSYPMECHRFLFKEDVVYTYTVVDDNLVTISPIPADFSYRLLDDNAIELVHTGATDCAMPAILATYTFTKI